jgi:5-formyltetrahydrofolate cyclo-ligase
MQSEDAPNAKKSLRSQLSEARQTLAKDPQTSSMLAAQLNQLVSSLQAKTVAAYLPFGTEPNIMDFVAGAAAHGIKLIMPVSQLDQSMHWVEYTGHSAPGIFGFHEPTGMEAALESAQLILIPASAADKQGNRLGKGKGFYDIALSQLATKIPIAAVVYDQEVLEQLPIEAHDQAVDYVVTPKHTFAVG